LTCAGCLSVQGSACVVLCLQGLDEPFLEQWHQKLHQNTTPEDVTICEAYLAFLHRSELAAVLLQSVVTAWNSSKQHSLRIPVLAASQLGSVSSVTGPTDLAPGAEGRWPSGGVPQQHNTAIPCPLSG
jgi:hypothetical protein